MKVASVLYDGRIKSFYVKARIHSIKVQNINKDNCEINTYITSIQCVRILIVFWLNFF